MSEQYFTSAPTSAHEERHVQFQAGSRCLRFETDAGTFSKGHLDPGSRLLIDTVPNMTGRCADIGCGWGAIGVSLARANPACRVVMADVNRRALELAKANLARNGVSARCVESDGMASLSGLRFDAVVTNPPIRAGKQVIYRMFADAAACLNPGGALYLVIRKQQGAESCIRYLKGLYAQVDKIDKSGGFWVLRAREPLGGKDDTHDDV